ncbi:hypothetical protein AAVH_08745 [Aphelenchoides avenae]|nr:hypothetical protein AAVH_08745 [Aphelenchus avenae]
MPLHRIYHAAGAFTDEQQQGLAQAITDIYVEKVGLPPFYVVVLFVEVAKESFFIGGEPTDKFVRITVQHIARQFENDEQKKGFLDLYEGTIAPFIKERGFDWEVSVELVDRDLWRENGLIPPQPNSEAEKEWKRLNKAVPYE